MNIKFHEELVNFNATKFVSFQSERNS